jgi:ATP-dependent helicase HrpA
LLLAEADATAPATVDVEAQLAMLVYPGFISATPVRWFGRLPVYLRAARRRLQKLPGAPVRDRSRETTLAPWLARWREIAGDDAATPERIAYRWLLEEFRVSLFAQELGTAVPVSPARLEKQWAKVVAERR